MNKLMPYFRLMKKFTILMIVIAFSMVITNDGKEILTGFKHSVFENGYLIFKSEIYSITVFLMFIYGIYFSYKKFNVAMNIKADRKSYIKASIISMIGMGIVFAIFVVLWGLILKFIVEYVSGKNSLIIGDSAYFLDTVTVIINSFLETETTMLYAFSDLSIKRFIIDILNQFLTLSTFSSIGFLLGSILYRLKKKTSIIIFLVIPTIVITLGVGFSIFKTDLIMNYISINLVISLICSVLLLKNAPIKEYAHDLI